jgi:hypothetical protein
LDGQNQGTTDEKRTKRETFLPLFLGMEFEVGKKQIIFKQVQK